MDHPSQAAGRQAKSREREPDGLPCPADMQVEADALRAFAVAARHAVIVGHLASLAATAPQVLLFEGGSARERSLITLFWAAALNCPHAPERGCPCFACSVCLRIACRQHRDLYYMDGSTETIKIGDVRAMRAVLGEAPRDMRLRVVILAEAQSLTDEAANALLKSLEESSNTTVFALAAPQRERLLPTLVSRSWALTLPWPAPGRAEPSEEHAAMEEEWDNTLALFLQSGKGLFERTAARGAVDARMAHVALIAWQRALANALAGQAATPLAQLFARFSESQSRMADEAFAEGQDSLGFKATPAYVVEWMATRIYLLHMQGKR